MISFNLSFFKVCCFNFFVSIFIISCQAQTMQSMDKPNQYNTLNDFEKYVIIDKGTERPFTGEYVNTFDDGIYVCRQCNTPLYHSKDKFHTSCGWPSFDDEIDGAVTRTLDADGRRTEITCTNCGGHLGHVFEGEELTLKNIRHCVNSVSIKFIPASKEKNIDTAIFAGGCFWGVEYYFQNEKGVLKTEVGYTGGSSKKPTYEEVCSKKTGHYEALRVTFDSSKTSYEHLAKLFFEIHNPSQSNGQGNDIGPQYESAIFYNSPAQKQVAEKLIQHLEEKGIKVATKVLPATTFWLAEDYHQQYYEKKGGTPYCHFRVQRFD